MKSFFLYITIGYNFDFNNVDFLLFVRVRYCSGPVDFIVQHCPVDIRYDAEGHDADGHKDKGKDEAKPDAVLPILSSLVRLSQRNFQTRIVLNQSVAFREINNVPFPLCFNEQIVQLCGDCCTEARQVCLSALNWQTHTIDEGYGNVRCIQRQRGESRQVSDCAVLARFF